MLAALLSSCVVRTCTSFSCMYFFGLHGFHSTLPLPYSHDSTVIQLQHYYCLYFVLAALLSSCVVRTCTFTSCMNSTQGRRRWPSCSSQTRRSTPTTLPYRQNCGSTTWWWMQADGWVQCCAGLDPARGGGSRVGGTVLKCHTKMMGNSIHPRS